MILFIFPVYLVIVVLFVLAFWYPLVAGGTFLISSIIFEIYLFLINRIKFQISNKEKWSDDEKEILQKYSLYFRFIRIPRLFSFTLTAIQLSVLFWVPLLLYKNHWLLAVIIGLNYFMAGLLSAKLDPKFFLRDAISKGKSRFSRELDLINNINKKLDEESDT